MIIMKMITNEDPINILTPSWSPENYAFVKFQ